MSEIDAVAAMRPDEWAASFASDWKRLDPQVRSSVAYSAALDTMRSSTSWAERAGNASISDRRRRMCLAQSEAIRLIASMLMGLAIQADAEIDGAAP